MGLRALLRGSSTVAIIVALIAINGLTLLNDSIHDAAYRALSAVLGRIIGATPEAISRKEARGLRKENKSLDQKVKAVDNENATLKKRTELLEAENSSVKERADRADRENRKMRQLAERRKGIVRQVSSRVARRTAVSAVRGAATVLPKAVPIVGTALIVSGTALDIKDACDTIADLNELGSAFDEPTHDSSKVCGITLPTRAEVEEHARRTVRMFMGHPAGGGE